MLFSKGTSPQVTVIAPEKENLDRTTVQDLKRSFAPLIQPNARVVLDLGRVSRVDSVGVGAVLTIHRQMKAVGGKVKLSSIPKSSRTIFQKLHMHWVFDIYNAKEEAVESFEPCELCS
jgi:anti-sigma B factor antagonist